MGNKPVTEVSFYQPPNNLNEGYCKSKPKYVESKKTCHSQPSSLEKSFSHRSEYDRIAIQEYNRHALSMDYTPYVTKETYTTPSPSPRPPTVVTYPPVLSKNNPSQYFNCPLPSGRPQSKDTFLLYQDCLNFPSHLAVQYVLNCPQNSKILIQNELNNDFWSNDPVENGNFMIYLNEKPLSSVSKKVASRFLNGSKYVVIKCTSDGCSNVDAVKVHENNQGSIPIYTLFPNPNVSNIVSVTNVVK